jgi:HupE / UreJ protein
LFVAFPSGFAFGHNPITSWAVVQLHPDRLDLRLEMASESAWIFLGEAPDSPPDVAGSLSRLKKHAAEVYQLYSGGRGLVPLRADVEFHDEDGSVIFRLFFPRPGGAQRRDDFEPCGREPLIAASIAFVGVENLVRRGQPKGRSVLTFGFGLVHGFGFASVLREAGVGTSGRSLVLPLFSFNLGVELGQLAVVAVLLPLLWKLRTRPAFARHGVSVVSVVVVLLGGYWLLRRTLFA